METGSPSLDFRISGHFSMVTLVLLLGCLSNITGCSLKNSPAEMERENITIEYQVPHNNHVMDDDEKASLLKAAIESAKYYQNELGVLLVQKDGALIPLPEGLDHGRDDILHVIAHEDETLGFYENRFPEPWLMIATANKNKTIQVMEGVESTIMPTHFPSEWPYGDERPEFPPENTVVLPDNLKGEDFERDELPNEVGWLWEDTSGALQVAWPGLERFPGMYYVTREGDALVLIYSLRERTSEKWLLTDRSLSVNWAREEGMNFKRNREILWPYIKPDGTPVLPPNIITLSPQTLTPFCNIWLEVDGHGMMLAPTTIADWIDEHTTCCGRVS
ncbi:MAG: hypothetical protein GC168_15195 [Candidatus Hydrogenedens sp.]|nr:hypothetical protein [Candidatus Hydrogenedens sp.]